MKRPCLRPRCPRLTEGSYCEEHERRKSRDYDRTRTPAHKRGYGGPWRRIRRAHLARWPGCERCGVRMMKGMHVHHRDHDVTNNRASNLETLCPPCHNREHGRTNHHSLRR